MGAETYKQLKKLMSPGKPNDENNTHDIITEKLKSHYCRKKNEIVDFAVELQSLAKKCDFSTFLDKR